MTDSTTTATATEQELDFVAEHLTGTDPVFITVDPTEASVLRGIGFATRAVSIWERVDGSTATAKICELWKAGTRLAPLILIGDYIDKVATTHRKDTEAKRAWGEKSHTMWTMTATLKDAGMMPGIDFFIHGDEKTVQSDDYDILNGRGKTTTYNSIAEATNDGNAGRQTLEDGINHAAKRAQELQRQGRAAQEQKQENERETIRQTSAAGNINKLIDIINTSANTPPTSSGFKELDNALDGGLYEGLYILGAISSLGKTTFVMQIADRIAETNRDVLIFSLEMARTELMAKSISRHTFTISKDKTLALSTRGVTDGRRYENYTANQHNLIREAIEEYKIAAQNIYIHEGIGDITTDRISETIKTHSRATGTAPIVIVDYLQIIAPHSDRASDKQATDKAVLELKRLSRDFKIPIIAISSLNRENYNAPMSMRAFKESGAIEFSADVLIGLQLKGAGCDGFDVDIAKAKTPRDVELIILKNRNGPTGGKVPFEYYSKFNFFKEK